MVMLEAWLKWLVEKWQVLAAILYVAALLAHGHAQWNGGYNQAKTEGDQALAELKLTYAEQALQVAAENKKQLLQQVTRANQAEDLLLVTYDRHAEEVQLLKERITNVTTIYRPAPGAAAQPIPRCVFTAGWLRDYNTALGVPAPGAATATAGPTKASWATPGTDAELLESGVTPADILAHAQDYGRWARDNLAQLNALLDLHKD